MWWQNPNMFGWMTNNSFYQGVTPLVIVLVVWELYWKGKGLWLSAQKKEKWWFIAMLLLNTVGILPLVYIYYFSKRKNRI